MPNSNKIYQRKNIDGSIDYIVDLGNIIYNGKILTLNKLTIPLRRQVFFSLPEDRNKYILVNAYYKVESGQFVFDSIKKSDKPIDSISYTSIPNLIPIGQFLIRQSLSGIEVTAIYEYSKMASFALTKNFEEGDRGLQGPAGETGIIGITGFRGLTGADGLVGFTGARGLTGVGDQGMTGLQGPTGYYPDPNLTFYAKFKSDDDTLQDYSIYERDFGWTSIGAGFYADPGSGSTFIALDKSGYTLEDGIVDNCHSLSYNGGRSGFTWGPYTGFAGFSGLIQAWIRIDMYPLADFNYTIDPLIPLKVSFTDTSKYLPSSWEWEFEGVGTSEVQNPVIIFPSSGDYIVTLKASNAAGMTEKTKMISI